nr:hypothetical protein [Burkholderia sp. Ac-20345]
MTEASKRKGRSADEWMIAERAEVFREATGQAQKLSLRSPSIEEVERQEQLAMGHSDYAAKWAIGVADLMTH